MGYFPHSSLAFQPWVHYGKPSSIIPDRIKYLWLDTALRTERVAQWNQAVWWPLGLAALALLTLCGWALRTWRQREMATARRT